MTAEKFDIKWIDSGREPKSKPNPNYPNGIDLVDHHPGQKHCKVELPYPAKRCGAYIVKCHKCGFTAVCTTAGRPDDPRSITLGCKHVTAH